MWITAAQCCKAVRFDVGARTISGSSGTATKPHPIAHNNLSPSQGSRPRFPVAAGTRFSCAVLADGSARCWGFDGFGQFGTDTLPTNPNTLSTSAAHRCHQHHTSRRSCFAYDVQCVLLANGSVMCWGENDSGEELATARPRPTTVFPTPFWSTASATP